MQKFTLAAAAGMIAWLVAKTIEGQAERIPAGQVLAMIDQLNRTEFGGQLNPMDVLALVQVESSFRPGVMRYEEHLGEASVGLTQVLLSTARDRGYAGGPGGLTDPVMNLRMGMRQLVWIRGYLANRFNRSPTRAEIFGAYNAGVGNVAKGHVPMTYVQKIETAKGRLEADPGALLA